MKEMKFKIPRRVKIAHMEFKIVKDKKTSGGEFDWKDNTIRIGTQYLESDPAFVWAIICHELSELCHTIANTRYDDPSAEDNYKFFMDHKEFEMHNCLFASAIAQFMK